MRGVEKDVRDDANDWVNYYTIIQYHFKSVMVWTALARYNLVLWRFILLDAKLPPTCSGGSNCHNWKWGRLHNASFHLFVLLFPFNQHNGVLEGSFFKWWWRNYLSKGFTSVRKRLIKYRYLSSIYREIESFFWTEMKS